MKLGMIGLGQMGSNLLRRLLQAGHECVAYDTQQHAVEAAVKGGAVGATSLQEFVQRLSTPRAIWMMLPAAVVDSVLKSLIPLLEPDPAPGWPSTLRGYPATLVIGEYLKLAHDQERWSPTGR